MPNIFMLDKFIYTIYPNGYKIFLRIFIETFYNDCKKEKEKKSTNNNSKIFYLIS